MMAGEKAVTTVEDSAKKWVAKSDRWRAAMKDDMTEHLLVAMSVAVWAAWMEIKWALAMVDH